MVQGFQTLASSTVAEVGRQSGVAGAVGGLNLRVLKVSGQFTPGQFQQNGGQRGARGYGQPGGEVKGGGADFDINSYSVYGTDVTKPALGPLTSPKITRRRTFKSSESTAAVAVVDSGYATQNKLSVGSSLTIKSVKSSAVGIATADSGTPPRTCTFR